MQPLKPLLFLCDKNIGNVSFVLFRNLRWVINYDVPLYIKMPKLIDPSACCCAPNQSISSPFLPSGMTWFVYVLLASL